MLRVIIAYTVVVDRDSSVDIATCYRLDGPGIVAARLLGSGVLIPPGAWMFVLCVVE